MAKKDKEQTIAERLVEAEDAIRQASPKGKTIETVVYENKDKIIVQVRQLPD